MPDCETDSPYFDQKLYQEWRNYSAFHNSSDDLRDYVCAYTKYLLTATRLNWVSGIVNCICAIFGFGSSFLTLCTLCGNEKFSQNSFCYFRFVAALEIFHMIHIASSGMGYAFMEAYIRTFAWYWFSTVLGRSIANFVSLCVDLTTIHLSIERAVACLLPGNFHFLERRNVVLSICCGIFSFSFAFYASTPFAYSIKLAPSSGTYVITFLDSFRTLSKALEIVGYAVAIAVVISCVLAVVGLLSALKRR